MRPRCILLKVSPHREGLCSYKVISWNPPVNDTLLLPENWTLEVNEDNAKRMAICSFPGGGYWIMPAVSLGANDTYNADGEEFRLSVMEGNNHHFQKALLNFNILFSNNSNISMEDVIMEGRIKND
jgi:hypothetical protein